MAARKKNTSEGACVKEKSGYTKQQIIDSDKYSDRKDLLNAILKDSTYTLEDVEKEINSFMKGQVK